MADSLRTLLERRVDKDRKALTLEGSAFGARVDALLALLAIPRLALADVTFEPALGTNPPPSASTVKGTASLWGSKPSSVTLAVTQDGDSAAAHVTLTTSIDSITLKALADTVLPIDSSKAYDAITITKGAVTAVVPDTPLDGETDAVNTLSFKGTLSDTWNPFGLDKVRLERPTFAFARLDDPSWGVSCKVVLGADLFADQTRIPIAIEVPLDDEGEWSAAIVPPGVTLRALTDIAALFGGAAAAAVVPPKLADLTTLQLKTLRIQFDPTVPEWSAIDFDIATGKPWPIADHIQIDGVGLRLSVRSGDKKAVMTGTAYGQLTVDPLVFQANVPIPLHGAIHLEGRTNQPLPGFGALAKLADARFAESLPDGIANLGSLQIDRLALDYDVDREEVVALGIDIESGGPWTLIPDYLSLDHLQFGVDAAKVSKDWVIRGGARGTILVAGIRVAVGIDGGAGEWTVALTEPLRLPSIAEMAALIGGKDAPSIFPKGFGEGVGALTISRYEMTFGGDKNGLQHLALDFATSEPWKFWDPHFVLRSLDVSLDVGAPVDGKRQLDAAIAGIFDIGPIPIGLSATHAKDDAGWTFTGGLPAGEQLAFKDLLAYLETTFKVGSQVPDSVKSIVLTGLEVTFVTDTHAFTFHVGAELKIADTPVEMIVDFAVTPGDTFTLHVTGDLTIGAAHFTVTFETVEKESRLIATWDQANKPIGFDEIAGAFGFTAPQLPEKLDLSLDGAGISYNFTTGQLLVGAHSKHYGQLLFVSELVEKKRLYLVNLDVPLGLHLSALPVAGEHIPKDLDVGIKSLEIAYASGELSSGAIKDINTAAEKIKALPLSADTLGEGVTFAGVVALGDTEKPFSLPLSSRKAGKKLAPRTDATDAMAGAPGALTVADEAPPTYDSGAKWFTIGKTLGPIQLERIGLAYEDAVLSVLFDASLTVSALSFSFQGLGLGSPLTAFKPTPHLDGMALSFESGPLQISGGIIRVAQLPPNVEYEYIGAVTIAAKPWMIQGVASYARVSGAPSFFLFAQLIGELGGPPFFFVTGVMGGFGFNSRLRLPAPEDVATFPFLAGLDDPKVFGDKPTPMSALAVLAGKDEKSAWVTPSLGDNWVAAGILFRSCELVVGRALLVVEFGHGFEIALLGLARMSLPQGSGTNGYAYVELQLEAVFRPGDGYFGLVASLTSASFLLDKACHLTGGFAFCLWFGEHEHAGDFVISIGGYHPAFDRPDWYPALAPVGFNWTVGDTVTIKGGAYFALTPGAIMAGGSLEVLFQSGAVRAWFTAYAHLLIGWKPFHFRAEIGISLGAAVTVDLLVTTVTLSFELGATLEMWGPPTGGIVHVHLWIFSFSVPFGVDAESAKPPALTWKGFEGLLPQTSAPAKPPKPVHATLLAAADADVPPLVLSTQINAGLTRQGDDGAWHVRGDDLAFSVVTAVPATALVFRDGVPVMAKGAKPVTPPSTISIRPMGLDGVTSPLTIALTNVTTGDPVGLTAWSHEPQAASLPEAMWGGAIADPTTPPLSSKTVGGLPVGTRLIPPASAPGASAGPMDLAALTDSVGTGNQPLRPGSPADADRTPATAVDPNIVDIIKTTLASDASREAQRRLLEALAHLKAAPPTSQPLSKLADAAGASFSQPPLKAA